MWGLGDRKGDRKATTTASVFHGWCIVAPGSLAQHQVCLQACGARPLLQSLQLLLCLRLLLAPGLADARTSASTRNCLLSLHLLLYLINSSCPPGLADAATWSKLLGKEVALSSTAEEDAAAGAAVRAEAVAMATAMAAAQSADTQVGDAGVEWPYCSASNLHPAFKGGTHCMLPAVATYSGVSVVH